MATPAIFDRVWETSTTTGTGAFTVAGAVTGYRALSSVYSTGDVLPYCIEGVSASGVPTGEWECGYGTYSSANTLTRSSVTASSNSNAAVTFSAGTKNVFVGQIVHSVWKDRVFVYPVGSDHTALIQGAIDWLINNNGSVGAVVLASSTAWVSSTQIQIPKGITLYLNGSVVNATPSNTANAAIKVNGPTASVPGFAKTLVGPGHWKGYATVGSGYTASSKAIECNAFSIVIENVTFTGWAKPTVWDDNSYLWTFDRCSFRYGQYGAIYEYPSSNSGEAIVYRNCELANNVYNVYNNKGYMHIQGGVSDYPTTAHIGDNITDTGGVAVGLLVFEPDHVETTRAVSGSTPSLVTNSGRMIFAPKTFLFDPTASNFIVNASGAHMRIRGVQWQLTADDYVIINNSGIVVDDGTSWAHRDDFVMRLTSSLAKVLNPGFESSFATGWSLTGGTNASRATSNQRTGSGCLSIAPTNGSTGTSVASKTGLVPAGKSSVQAVMYARNTHTSQACYLHVVTYDADGGQYDDQYQTAATSMGAYSRFKITAAAPPQGGYFTITMNIGASATTNTPCYVDDIYVDFI